MSKYTDFYFERKDKKRLPYPYSKKSLAKLSSYIQGNVLEIGVGDGKLSGFLLDSKRVNSYTGVDLYEEFLIKVKDELNNKKLTNIHLIQGDFTMVEFNTKFDTIFSFEVIEHVRLPEIFLEKIYNLLKPNGIAIVSTPNKYVYDIVAKIADGGRDPTHISEMTYRKFKKLFSKYFRIVDSVYMLPFFPKFSYRLGSDKIWYSSEIIGKIIKFISLDVVLVGRK